MAGYAVHLAVAKELEKSLNIINTDNYYLGVCAPDLFKLVEKQSDLSGLNSHFGNSSNTNVAEFYQIFQNYQEDDFMKGAFVHIITDYCFYKKLTLGWYPNIYKDYDKTNKTIIDKYKIDIPQNIKHFIKYEEGPTERLCKFNLLTFIESFKDKNINELMELYFKHEQKLKKKTY